MARKKTGQEEISEKLHEAIDGLRKDVTRVEIWATALGSFSQPVPDYAPDRRRQLGQANGDAQEQAAIISTPEPKSGMN